MAEPFKPSTPPMFTKPKVKKWKVANGASVVLPSTLYGNITITNKDLEDESVIKMILLHEKDTGHQILGNVIVEA